MEQIAGLPLLAWVPLFPLLGALVNLTLGARLSKRAVSTIAVGSVAAACGLAFYLVFWQLFQTDASGNPLWKTGGIEQTVYTWLEVGNFKAQLAFRLDTLSAVMILIVTFVGMWIHIYSTGYMA